MIESISVAVVTGGAHGIGRALCRALHGEGVKVVVADIDSEGARQVADELGATSIAVDVGDEASVAELVSGVENQIGPIDLFISNAGVGFGDEGDAASARGGIRDVADRWEACWRINVMAHVYAARVLLPQMRERGGGHFVNVASAAGLLSQIGDSAYTATKHAAVAFAESLAITHGDEGIDVSVVCPQAVATRMIGVDEDSGAVEGGFGGNDVDGVLKPDEVAKIIIEGVREKRFLILTHPEVAEYVRRKAGDRDRWIGGMRRFRRSITES